MNLEKAFYWNQKAAENGYIEAQSNLAALYLNGEKIEKNLEKAFYWYQKVAESKNKNGIYLRTDHLKNKIASIMRFNIESEKEMYVMNVIKKEIF